MPDILTKVNTSSSQANPISLVITAWKSLSLICAQKGEVGWNPLVRSVVGE
jgi:hypothetical protein